MPEISRDYELVVIIVPPLDDQGIATAIERISGWITSGGGTIGSTNVWGRRTLAYAIKKLNEGVYIQFNYQLLPSKSRELERSLRIDEQILRHLLVRPDLG